MLSRRHCSSRSSSILQRDWRDRFLHLPSPCVRDFGGHAGRAGDHSEAPHPYRGDRRRRPDRRANLAGASLGIIIVQLTAVVYATYTTDSWIALSSVDSGTLTATALIATTVNIRPYGVVFGQLSILTARRSKLATTRSHASWRKRPPQTSSSTFLSRIRVSAGLAVAVDRLPRVGVLH